MGTKKGKIDVDRPSWNEYFMLIAFAVSVRSLDPTTKHGCVLVDKDNRIVSTGYNSPVSGIDDRKVPLTRPDKYDWMIHAEDNAVAYADRSALDNSTAYVTGHPCVRCFRLLLQSGCKKIVFGPRLSHSLSSHDIKTCQSMARLKGVRVINFRAQTTQDAGRQRRLDNMLEAFDSGVSMETMLTFVGDTFHAE